MRKLSPEEIQRIVDQLSADEVVTLASGLGNIDSPAVHEREAGIPGAMCGPYISLFGGLSVIKASELVRAAKLYTWIALECCSLEN